MPPRRITATSSFWRHQASLAGNEDQVEPDIGNSLVARASLSHTKVPLNSSNACVAEGTSVWLRKHGRALKPKLSVEQGRQLQQCFRLMDADGSGAIGSDELNNAFKLLGIKARKSTIDKMIAEAGADESGEVGYNAFVAMMEPILTCKGTEFSSTSTAHTVVKSGSAVSFDTSIIEYRRKKIIQALHERDTEVLGMLSAAPGTSDAGPPAVQAMNTPKALPVPSNIQRSHSASSDIVEAALQEHNTFLKSSKCTSSSQQKHQSSSAAHQPLSAQPALPDLQAKTEKSDSKGMLRRQITPIAAQHAKSHAQHGTASAARSVIRQRDSHLAALRAQGELEAVLQNAACQVSQWPAQQRLHVDFIKLTAAAGQTKAKQNSKPNRTAVRDMFGVAIDNSSSTDTDLGLVLMRPASSLW